MDDEQINGWTDEIRKGILCCPVKSCSQRFFMAHAFLSHITACCSANQSYTSLLKGGTLPCPLCASDVTLKQYTRHIRSNHKDAFADMRILQKGDSVKCPNYSCHQIFSEGTEYLEHAVTCKPCYICEICLQTYKSSRNLQVHTCIGHPVKEIGHPGADSAEGDCIEARLEVGDKRKRKQSMPLRAGGSSMDPTGDGLIVKRTNDIEGDLAKWEENVRRGILNCPNSVCQERFYLPHPFVSHLESCDQSEPHIKSIISRGTLPCPLCPASVAFKKYSRHVRTNHQDPFTDMRTILQGNIIACSNYKCKLFFDDGFKYLRHVITCKPCYQCEHCEQTYKKRKSLVNHACNRVVNPTMAGDYESNQDIPDDEAAASNDGNPADEDIQPQEEVCSLMIVQAELNDFAETSPQSYQNDSMPTDSPAILLNAKSPHNDGQTEDSREASVTSTGSQDVVASSSSHEDSSGISDMDRKVTRWWADFVDGRLVCPNESCGETFVVPIQLFNHMSKCKHRSKFGDAVRKVKPGCLSCKQTFASIPELNRHFRAKHLELLECLTEMKEKGTARCRNHTCDVVLSTVNEAVHHITTCGVLLLCQGCKRVYKSLVGMKTHTCKVIKIEDTPIKSNAGKSPINYRACYSTNADLSTLDETVAKWTEKYLNWEFSCANPSCGALFHSPSILLSHMSYQCQHPSPTGHAVLRKPIPCCRCKKTFPVAPKHNQHFRSFHLNLFLNLDELSKQSETKCMNMDCNTILRSASECNDHDLKCKFLQKCQLCCKAYRSLAGFKSHICIPEVQSMASKQSSDTEENGARAKRQRKKINLSEVDPDNSNDESDQISVNDEAYDPSVDETPADDLSTNASTNSRKRKPKLPRPVSDEPYNFRSDFCRLLTKRKKMTLSRNHQTFRVNASQQKKMMKWFEENRSDVCFPEFSVAPEKIVHLSQGEATSYLPTNAQSPFLEFSYLDQKGHRIKKEASQLELFESWSDEDVSSTANLFVGGPVQAIEWCPDEVVEDRYLAVSAHFSHSQIHDPSSCENASGLIQIWKTKRNENGSFSWEFSYGIAHDWGPVYNFKWCPTGGLVNSAETGNRLGCLVLACGDGLARILSIPHPDVLSKMPSIKVVRLPTSLLLTPRGSSVTERNPHLSKVWCVDWCRTKDHAYIAAGYADGCVCIYKIHNISPLLRDCRHDVLPVKKFHAHDSFVSDLCFNPSDPNYIATASWDKQLKIFNLRAAEAPVYVWKRGSMRCLLWPVMRCSLFYGEDESFHGIPSSARCLDFLVSLSQQSAILYQHNMTTTHNSSVMATSYSDWLDTIVTCCSGGEMVLRVFHDKVIRYPLPLYRIQSPAIETLCTPASSLATIERDIELSNLDRLQKVRGEFFERTQEAVANADLLVLNRSYLIRDSNYLEFSRIIGPMSADIQRTRTNTPMQATPLSLHNPLSLNVVKWHPSFKSRTFLASGGNLGLVRIHNLSSWMEVPTNEC